MSNANFKLASFVLAYLFWQEVTHVRTTQAIPVSTDTVTSAMPVCSGTLAHVMYVIDASGCVDKKDFETIKTFMKQVMGVFEGSFVFTKVGVIAYDYTATVQFGLNQYNSANGMKSAIDNIVLASGETNTGLALRTLREQGFSTAHSDVERIAIVITDGVSSDPIETKIQARLLKESGVVIISIGIGNDTNQEELKAIASVDNVTGNSLVFEVNSFQDLQVKQEHFTTTCLDCKTVLVDFMFVIDATGSVGKKNFEAIKAFMKQIIDTLDIKAFIRVGVITYDSTATIQFGLNQFNSSAGMKSAIDNIGETNTGIALLTLREHGFSTARPDVPRIAIVITVGVSSDPIATKVQARRLKESGVAIIAIGVGNATDPDDLRAIASVETVTGKSLVYEVDSFQYLHTLKNMVANKACSAAVVSPTPSTNGATYPSTTACLDGVSNCAAYGASVCSDYKPWAMVHCIAFCGVCTNGKTTTPPPCVNKINNCHEYGSYICTQVSLFVWTKEHCPLYCKFCSI